MKRIGTICFYLLVIFSSCALQEEKLDYGELDRNLDAKNLQLLESLIRKMENHLESTYGTGNRSDNYKSYFLNISLGNSHLKISDSHCLVLRHYENSDLSEKYSIVNYDTVYVDDNLLVSVIENDTTFEIIPGTSDASKLVQDEMEHGFLKVQAKGKLYEALTSLENQDEMLSQYLSRKEATWNVDPKQMASYFATSQIDVSENYILKVLVLNEIYMNELKSYGC